MRSGCCDDLRAAARLLHSETTKKERANGRGKAPARFLRFLQSVGRPGHSTPLAGVGRFLSFLAGWRARSFAPETTVFPRRRAILVLPRRLVAERRAFDRNKRRCAQGGAGCPPGCRSFGENRLRGRTGRASPHLHDKFHRRWRTTFLVFDLSRSSPDQLCTSHCSGQRQRSHPKTDRTSSKRIEQTGAGRMDYRPAAANESRRNSCRDPHLRAGGHGSPPSNPAHTDSSDLSFPSNECYSTLNRSCGVEG